MRQILGFKALIAFTGLLYVLLLGLIFFYAPVELQMGIVQKIFYFHVPSAYAMYLGFAVCALGSLLYLIKNNERAERWALAGAEVGLVFCLIVLITGPLWARKAWGVYWTWDPRLTTTLLAGLIYAAYVALRSPSGAGGAERKLAAGLAVLGLIDLPIIHWSVKKWRGQHPTVISREGGGLAPDMVLPLVLSFVAFTLLIIVLVKLRVQLEALKQAAEELDRRRHA